MWLLFLAFKIAEMGDRRKSDDNGKDLHSHFSFSLAFLEPLGLFPPPPTYFPLPIFYSFASSARDFCGAEDVSCPCQKFVLC